jgi:hypothetical protein
LTEGVCIKQKSNLFVSIFFGIGRGLCPERKRYILQLQRSRHDKKIDIELQLLFSVTIDWNCKFHCLILKQVKPRLSSRAAEHAPQVSLTRRKTGQFLLDAVDITIRAIEDRVRLYRNLVVAVSPLSVL